MAIPSPSKNERRGRREPKCDHAGLRVKPGAPLCRARIANESASGVALLMKSNAPAEGSTVRLFVRCSSAGKRASVVRVEPARPGHVLVGCCWLPAVNTRILPPDENDEG